MQLQNEGTLEKDTWNDRSGAQNGALLYEGFIYVSYGSLWYVYGSVAVRKTDMSQPRLSYSMLNCERHAPLLFIPLKLFLHCNWHINVDTLHNIGNFSSHVRITINQHNCDSSSKARRS